MIVGPLALVGIENLADPSMSGQFRDTGSGRYYAHKVLVALRPGSTVTIVVPAAEREYVSLQYDGSRLGNLDNLYRIDEGDVATRFEACDREADTQFAGAFIVAGARCVDLDFVVDGATEVISRRISFGHGGC